MKLRTGVLILIVLLAATSALAGPFGKTVKAGVTLMKMTNDVAGDSDYKSGMAAGVGLSYPMVPGLTLAPELLYVQQGGKYSGITTDIHGHVTGSSDFNYGLNYLQVPVLARVNLPVVGALLPTVVAGPALSFKLSSTFTADGEESDWDGVASTDFGWIVGLAFKVGVGPSGFTMDVRYNNGTSNLNDTDGEAVIHNRGFQVLGGFAF